MYKVYEICLNIHDILDILYTKHMIYQIYDKH